MNNNEVPVDNKTIGDKTAVEASTIETPKVEQPTTQLPEHEEVKYEEAESKPTSSIKNGEVRTDSYFDGKVLDLLGWKLLSALVTIVTATIAYPWGKCMIISYITNHTVLNGKRLKFEGTGGGLFVQRFKWIFFTIITLGIYGLWVPVKETNWILSNIHFEDESLIEGDSYFDGKFYQLYGINLLSNILNACSFGLLFPFTVCMKYKWLAKHAVINKKKIIFKGKAMSLLGHYILWTFLTIITLGIYSFWLQIKVEQWKVKNSHLKVVGEEYSKDSSVIVLSILVVVVIVFIVSLLSSLLKVDNTLRNELLSVGPKIGEEAAPLYISRELEINERYDINTLETIKNLGYEVEGKFWIISPFYEDYDYSKTSPEDISFTYKAENFSCSRDYGVFQCENFFLKNIESFYNGFVHGRSGDESLFVHY